jgi:hypothetical protein
VKQGAVVYRFYTTVSMVRTSEDILGCGYLEKGDSICVGAAAYTTPATACGLLKQPHKQKHLVRAVGHNLRVGCAPIQVA